MTHPFHPLFGREFELVTQKQAWGEDRVYFRDESKRLHHIPLGRTSVAPTDSFKDAANGRCRFSTEDLLTMADLMDALQGVERQSRKDNYAGRVKRKTPPSNSPGALNAAMRQRNTEGNQRRKQRRRN